MSSVQLALAVFACTFGGTLCGMLLRKVLPEHHLSSESRDSVKVAIGLVATITALVLGLVTASAKSSFDQLDAAVKHFAGDILALDRTLARYGPETAQIRAELKRGLAQRIEQIWPDGRAAARERDPAPSAAGMEAIASKIRALAPRTDDQRAFKDRAVSLGESMLEARWLVFASIANSVPAVFLATLVVWLTVTFTSYGLLAPRNATVVIALLVCALSVSAAVFLILEMEAAFDGVIRVSPEPLRFALERLGK